MSYNTIVIKGNIYTTSIDDCHYCQIEPTSPIVVVIMVLDDARCHRGIVAGNTTILDTAGAAGVLPNEVAGARNALLSEFETDE